jgi:hypothetical protein
MRYLLFSILIPVLMGCSSSQKTSKHSYADRKMLLRDEGISQLAYIDIANPANNWYVPVPPGRDMQLIGNGRILIGTGNGYEEHEIATGKKVNEVTNFPGTLTAHRLRNGNTLLSGVNWQGKQGIVLVELNGTNNIQSLIVYPGYDYARLVRQTESGTFMVTADNTVFEGTADGRIIWQATVTGLPKPHAWQAIRLANGQTVVSTGYAKNFQVFSADGKPVNTFTGPEDVKPSFFAGFQVMPNGNYVVTNWQGHGPSYGSSGVQVLEFTPQGALAWSWKQDATKFSSLQGIIVLDGLDLSKLHVEDKNGVLMPVK